MTPSGAPQREFAPAKVNLFLHVGPRGDDGYHPICSLMCFADVGDELVLRPAPAMGFTLTGPFGELLSHQSDNLVIRARDALMAGAAQKPEAFELALEKNLPIASGLGGGSADAAAALRLIRDSLDLNVSDEAVMQIARSLGADVPVCLGGQSVIATGRGDVLSPAPCLPDLHLVLVNPPVPSVTAKVYGAYDEAPADADRPQTPISIASAFDAAAFLHACRNDLERPAVGLQPKIGEALAALAAQPETLLARMSGSGATCFALCENLGAATAVERRLARAEPQWWVRHALLRGSAKA